MTARTHGGDPLIGWAEGSEHLGRDVPLRESAVAECVVKIVGQVGDPVREAAQHSLRGGRRRFYPPGVGSDAIQGLPRQVERFQKVEQPYPMGGVVPILVFHIGRERVLADMAEGGVTDVVDPGRSPLSGFR